MRKKVFFMIFTALILIALLLTACGAGAGNKGSEVKTAVTGDKDTAEEQDEGSGLPGPEAEENLKGTENFKGTENLKGTEKEGPGETEDGEPGRDFVRGTVTEAGWESKYLGLCYQAPEGMSMMAEKELKDMVELGREALPEDYDKWSLGYEELFPVYEMMSRDEPGTTTVVVVTEKTVTEDADAAVYGDAIKQGLKEASRIDYEIRDEEKKRTIGGTDFIKIACTADYNGFSLYQDYYIGIIGERAVTIAVTYTEETEELAKKAVNGFAVFP